MKIYTEVLSQELLKICKEDILKKQKEYVWASNSFNWDPMLLENIDGTCLFTLINDTKIKELLNSELSIAFTNYNYDELYYQYYIWDSYSGIASHNDGNFKFGATLYLNSNLINSGGLFLWKDEECPDNFYRCLNPQENMMVVNDSKEEHFVTSISPHAKEYRYTIQIWGE
jgi:hypothetical protein